MQKNIKINRELIICVDGPVQGFIAKKVNTLREKNREKSDERVNLLTEVLQVTLFYFSQLFYIYYLIT
jgi:hypothetical protein